MFSPCKEDYEREHENDEEYVEWYDYLNDVCPNVVFFDKYNVGYEYTVLRVTLMGDQMEPYFTLDCYNSELGKAAFTSHHIYDMTPVYELLEKKLEIEDEPEKVWIVKQESNDDGEMHFFTQPCKDEATAKSVLLEWKEALLTKHPKYCDAKPYIDGEKDPDDQACCFEWEDHDAGFYIKVIGDDYYENITIEEEKIR